MLKLGRYPLKKIQSTHLKHFLFPEIYFERDIIPAKI